MVLLRDVRVAMQQIYLVREAVDLEGAATSHDKVRVADPDSNLHDIVVLYCAESVTRQRIPKTDLSIRVARSYSEQNRARGVPSQIEHRSRRKRNREDGDRPCLGEDGEMGFEDVFILGGHDGEQSS